MPLGRDMEVTATAYFLILWKREEALANALLPGADVYTALGAQQDYAGRSRAKVDCRQCGLVLGCVFPCPGLRMAARDPLVAASLRSERRDEAGSEEGLER